MSLHTPTTEVAVLKLLGMSQRKATILSVLLSCLGLFLGWQVYHNWTEAVFMTIVVGAVTVVLFIAWRLVSNDELLADVRRHYNIVQTDEHDAE